MLFTKRIIELWQCRAQPCVAVLARLLIMSYTKILKIVIEVYSSVELDYPSRTATVSNVPYLQSTEHLFLTVCLGN